MPTTEFRTVKTRIRGQAPARKAGTDTEEMYMQVPGTPQITLPANITISGLKAKLKAEKEEDIRYQSRRWNAWEENYLLFRDTVELNRLTQRQAVNIPLIKETVKTILSKIQEIMTLSFQDRGGSEDKEIAITEFYRDDQDKQRLDLIDTVDKKQVLLYGRSHTKHNFKNGRWTYEVKDIRDIVVDKKTKPHDIQTARHIEELNIWKPLADILVDDRYDQIARDGLASQSTGNQDTGKANNEVIGAVKDATERDNRLIGLGIELSILDESAYETMVQLTQHYTEVWDASKKKYVRYVILTAGMGGEVDWILRAEPLKEAIGIDEWPIDTWADDLEATDYWSDGIVDSIRTINQTINIWFSQLIENRTLKNFGMNFYDSTASEGFTPEGYDPRPFGWYPLPGKPNDVYQNVKIDSLDSVIEDISFLVGLAEKASATGAIDKGVVEAGKRTLGEIEIAVSKSMERTTAMALYYRYAKHDMGKKWYNINAANVSDTAPITLYKQNTEGKLKGIKLTKSMWVSDEGYEITVESGQQAVTDRTDELIRMQAVKQFFPENPPLDEAIRKRAVMIAKFTPEEVTEIMDYEDAKKKQEAEAKEAVTKAGIDPSAPNTTVAQPVASPVQPLEELQPVQ